MSRLCMNCFAEVPEGSGKVCPVCGWDNGKPQRPFGLPLEKVLASRYVLGRGKAANGEGITYAALDSVTQRVVEIREFFPGDIARRGEDGSVSPAPGEEQAFEENLQEFLKLSKAVSRLRELSVVSSLLEIFEENDTAYAVYEYVPALSLRRYIENAGGSISWNDANRLFSPVLTALGLMNSLGVSHLGVSPETLRVSANGVMFLTGFSIPAVRRTGSRLRPELFPGCAAAEQYRAGSACGEASDVYGFAASLLSALTGSLPEEAPKRLRDPRLMISRDILKSLPPFAVTAIANALQVKPDDRTPSFERFKTELSSAPTVVDQVAETEAIRRLPSMDQAMPRHRGLPPVVWLIASLVITLAVLVIVAGRWLDDQGMSFEDLYLLFDRTSASAATEKVPDLVNQSYEEWSAKGTVTLKVSERIFSDTVEEGFIISQSPFAGEFVAPGTPILVTVSKGSQTRVLPPVEGMSVADLQALLTQNGFVIEQTEEESETVETGFVIRYQDHEPGDALDYGSTVTLVVSSGP